MTYHRYYLWLLICCLQYPLSAEYRTFTNDFGDSLEAELVELKETSDGLIVTMKPRGRTREIDAVITAFSQKDQAYIREWWAGVMAEKQLLKEDSRISITAKMNRKSKNNMYDRYYSVDDETKSFFPEVIIENDELDTFTGNTVRIVVIAEDRRYKDQKLIVSANTVEADFPERGQAVLESDPFRLRLYEYDSSYSNYDYEYGYEYEGYVVVIKNSDGEITHTRSTKSKYLTNMDVILECKAGEMYDESISRRLNVSPNSYFVQ